MSLCYERIPFHPDQTLGLSENRVRYPSLPLPSHCLKAHFPHQHCNNLGSKFRKTQGTLIGQFLFPCVNLNHYDFVGTIPTSHAAGCTKGGMAGTKSEIVEELDRAIDAASEAEEILRDVGDRVGEGKAMHTIAVPWQMGLGSKAK